jgi:AcrR family transcriptional regulator
MSAAKIVIKLDTVKTKRETDLMPASAAPARTRAHAYHHGDLRQAMLVAADRLIEEQGLEKFTLRECARRAGVSHGAPAHHFGDVRGLLTELATQGFEQLLEAMTQHEAAAPPDVYEQFIANGQAYVAFALAHRGRFQLMFRSDRTQCDDERLRLAGQATYGRLQQHMAAVLGAARVPGALPSEKALLAWVVVHGLSTLTLESGLFGGSGAERAAAAHGVFELFMRLLRPGLEGRTVQAAGRKPAAAR